jgi:hypothetical protein
MRIDVTAGVSAVADHLRLCIQARRLTLRAVEKELDMGEGYLGQLLRSNVDLKMKHVIGVLRVIGMEPEEFFSSLYSGTLPTTPPRSSAAPPPHPGGGSSGRLPGEVVPGVSEVRLDQLIVQLLERLSQRDLTERAESPPAQKQRGRKRR